jgi:hypothetical protein
MKVSLYVGLSIYGPLMTVLALLLDLSYIYSKQAQFNPMVYPIDKSGLGGGGFEPTTSARVLR